ncbi:MAG: prepilin-type N-terminal cleavage/methylation domain-containing protein [Xanthomonadales bacterium]|nr:prepilin-type N-terminal cleavage/methylation domain-containing protein [Xanthomonadales bacterium]
MSRVVVAVRTGHRQSGFSLIELALALLVLGLVAVLMVAFLSHQTTVGLHRIDSSLLLRADQALTGFAARHVRLPCPDLDGDGREDCAGGEQVGRLPFRDLGLPDLRAGRLRYGVLRQPGSAGLDLGRASDRFHPLLVASLPPIAIHTPLGNINGLDLCHQLHGAGLLPVTAGGNPDHLHTVLAGQPRTMAYALAVAGVDADGDGDLFDGGHGGSDARFVAPGAGSGHDNDDRVLAVAPAQLWARLQCGEAVSAAGHSHPNVANAAMILGQAATDYVEVQRLAVRLAEAKVDAGTAKVIATSAGISMAAAKGSIALSQTLLTAGAMAPVIAATAFALAANTGAAISAGIALNKAENALDEARSMLQATINYRNQLLPAANAMAARARQADGYGLH